jgi:hypothetical protein
MTAETRIVYSNPIFFIESHADLLEDYREWQLLLHSGSCSTTCRSGNPTALVKYKSLRDVIALG